MCLASFFCLASCSMRSKNYLRKPLGWSLVSASRPSQLRVNINRSRLNFFLSIRCNGIHAANSQRTLASPLGYRTLEALEVFPIPLVARRTKIPVEFHSTVPSLSKFLGRSCPNCYYFIPKLWC
ncbi:hypothetical protein BDV93DRAFT_247086 [Ceratobasidium sp. AG-I]|nr:hypothetical protein BDV93DRAFT_247086 [Ceratobasidium sp. AG-I]